MGIIAIPRILREKLSDDGAEALVDVINKAEKNSRENVLVYVEEKFERRLSTETGKLDKRITEETGKLDKRITEEVSKLDKRITEETGKLDKRITEETGKIRVEMGKMRADIIKWMFIFTFGQFWGIIGTMFLFFRK